MADKANNAKDIAVGNAIVCYDAEVETPNDTEKNVGVFAVFSSIDPAKIYVEALRAARDIRRPG